jgi:hypothetical protein
MIEVIFSPAREGGVELTDGSQNDRLCRLWRRAVLQ